MVMSEERAALIALASRLQVQAEELGPDAAADDAFVSALADFNSRTGAACTARTFAFLYQSQEPEELVDQLLQQRAPAAVLDLDTGAALIWAVGRVGDDADVTAAEAEEVGRALEAVSRLPEGWALSLVADGYGVGWSSEQAEGLVAFVAGHEPVSDRDGLLELTRVYLEARAGGEVGVIQHLRERLVAEAQQRLVLPELRSLIRAWERRGIITDDAALARLRRRLGLDD